MKRAFALALALAAGAAFAQATTVYRCGPDGREYSQAPCKDGKALDVADPRTDSERQAKQAMVDRDARLARRLERERLAAEAQANKQGAAAIRGVPAPGPAASAPAKRKPVTKKMKPRPPGAGTSTTALPSSRRAAD